MKNHAIEIVGLSKKFNGFCLNDINLNVEVGSIVGLIGHNGAGKTTLIKSVLGLVKRDAGEILMPCILSYRSGQDVRAFCGYIPETLIFYEWMRVEQLLKFVSGYYRLWDDGLCRQLLERYKLDSGKEIKVLSRGMRAKLALIISLSHRPPVLLLDEPTSGLDPMMRYSFLQELRRVVKEGTTQGVIISSHILGEIEQVADRIAIMKNGRIDFHGTVPAFLGQWSKITFDVPDSVAPELPHQYVMNELGSGCQTVVVRCEDTVDVMNWLRYQGATEITVTAPNLPEVFAQVW